MTIDGNDDIPHSEQLGGGGAIDDFGDDEFSAAAIAPEIIVFEEGSVPEGSTMVTP